MSNDARALWEREAPTYDQAPDHGLRDPATKLAWQQLLLPILGSEPLQIADVGCGTGTLSILLAEAGHHVSGVDFAPSMLEIAHEKASSVTPPPSFAEGDAADPPLPTRSFDVVLSRHVLWAMPDPAVAARNWERLLRPEGRLILVEGKWSTGAGLTAAECAQHLRQLRDKDVQLRSLDDPALWGGPIADERFLAIVSPRTTPTR